MKSKKIKILLTCEHAGYKSLKSIDKKLVQIDPSLKITNSHNNYDENALKVSQKLKSYLKINSIPTELVYFEYSRLLIDANRTAHNKGHYGPLSKHLSESEILPIKDRYLNYVNKINKILKKWNGSKVYIFSIHSFIPEFKGKMRQTDIGVLFRNHILKESNLALKFIDNYKKLDSKVKVHKNLPYRGHTDCLLNMVLDNNIKNTSINGFFFEFNQKLLKSKLNSNLIKSLGDALIKAL